MSKKPTVKGGDGSYCGIACKNKDTGNIVKYNNRADCPSWWSSPEKLGTCAGETKCKSTMEPGERCINSNGEILDKDKTECADDPDEYWGKVCVPKNYTKSTGHIGYQGGKYKNKKTKKQMKKSKSKRTKHMKKSKKNTRK